MFITQYYKYKYNGIIYVGGEVPEDGELLETMDILNAEESYNLIRIADEENVGNSVWLHDGDVENNYREEKQKND